MRLPYNLHSIKTRIIIGIMAKDDRLYSIKEFSTMAALTPSAVRFYQKNGVINPEQQPNGYFMLQSVNHGV